MVLSCDVAVVGSGPAGSAAALALARGGADVAIFEKDTLPRYKTCGGGVTYRAMRLLPADSGTAVERECFRAELSFVDAGLHFRVRRGRPIVYMTMRAELDRMLVRCAENAGARLFDACRVDDIDAGDGGVTLSTPRGQVKTRFLIAADGAASPVARKLNWEDGRQLIPAIEWEVRTDPNSFAALNQAARFDFGFVTDGYAWVFPKREHLSVGLASMGRGRLDLPSLQQRYLQSLPINRVVEVKRHGFAIPVTPRRGPLVRGRTFLVGDAAGLTDPVTAEGIGFAVMSGQAAAASLLASGWDAEAAGVDYGRRLRSTLLSEWRAGRILARLLYGMPRARNFLFRRHGQRLSEAMTEIVMGHRTYCDVLRHPTHILKLIRRGQTP